MWFKLNFTPPQFPIRYNAEGIQHVTAPGLVMNDMTSFIEDLKKVAVYAFATVTHTKQLVEWCRDLEIQGKPALHSDDVKLIRGWVKSALYLSYQLLNVWGPEQEGVTEDALQKALKDYAKSVEFCISIHSRALQQNFCVKFKWDNVKGNQHVTTPGLVMNDMTSVIEDLKKVSIHAFASASFAEQMIEWCRDLGKEGKPVLHDEDSKKLTDWIRSVKYHSWKLLDEVIERKRHNDRFNTIKCRQSLEELKIEIYSSCKTTRWPRIMKNVEGQFVMEITKSKARAKAMLETLGGAANLMPPVNAEQAGVVEEAPIENAPVEDAPMEDAPMEDAPVGIAPVGIASVGDAPVGIAPVGDAPVGDALVEHAPVEHAAVEDAPMGDAPVEHAPDKNHAMSCHGSRLRLHVDTSGGRS